MDNVYGITFYVTAGVLVAAMAALELYRFRSGKRGHLRRFVTPAAFGLGEALVEVEFEGGDVVEARLPACTQCVCRFRPGDAVLVTRTRGYYYVGTAAR